MVSTAVLSINNSAGKMLQSAIIDVLKTVSDRCMVNAVVFLIICALPLFSIPLGIIKRIVHG